MIPVHHPSDGLVVSYGAGGLDEGLSLAVAVHLTYCPHCRSKVRDAETVGGILLDAVEPVSLGEGMRGDILDRLDEASLESRAASADPRPRFPAPISHLLSELGTGTQWQRLAPGFAQLHLPLKGPSSARLLRVAPGKSIPEHRHGALELTLVLEGAFTDTLAWFRRGDLSEVDDSVVHRLAADPAEGCVCLAVTEAPVRFTGPLARLLGPIF